MEAWKKNLWILMVCVLTCSASFTMVVPFLPLFLFQLGVDERYVNLWAGVVFSAAFFVGAIMAPIWGTLADKFGRKKMVIRAGISLAIVYGLISIVQNPWQLLAARLLHGFVGGFVPASMAIVAASSPDQKIGVNLGFMQAAVATGTIMGPLFGGVLSEVFGMRLSFVVAAAVIFAGTAAVIFWVKEEHIPANQKRNRMRDDFRAAFRNLVLVKMLLLLFTFQLAFNIIQPLLTLYIADLQGKLEGAVLTSGFVLSLIGAATIIAAPWWGKAGESRGYRQVLMICLIVAGFVSTLQYFSGNIWQFGTLQFVFGLFFAGIIPAVNTIIVQNTDKDFRGRSFGLIASSNQLGAMTGPLIGGAISLWFGIPVVFVVTGIIMIAIGLFVWKDPAKWGHR